MWDNFCAEGRVSDWKSDVGISEDNFCGGGRVSGWKTGVAALEDVALRIWKKILWVGVGAWCHDACYINV